MDGWSDFYFVYWGVVTPPLGDVGGGRSTTFQKKILLTQIDIKIMSSKVIKAFLDLKFDNHDLTVDKNFVYHCI